MLGAAGTSVRLLAVTTAESASFLSAVDATRWVGDRQGSETENP